MDNNDIDKLLKTNIDLCKKICMNDPLEINGVLRKLIYVLNNNIPGDIVELGCNNGGTSFWIKKVLQIYNSNKVFHVYDSWQGVPEKHYYDTTENFKDTILPQIGGNKTVRDINRIIEINNSWKRGITSTQRQDFINTFKYDTSLELPIIHSGWFKDILDNEYPEKICFAYFDGDFYTSIIDSFNKVYNKMVKGGIIVIDDCGDNTLIGVKNACTEFLKDKPEVLNLNAYPSIDGEWDRTNFDKCFWGGWIQKV